MSFIIPFTLDHFQKSDIYYQNCIVVHCDKAWNHGRVDRLGQVYCPRSWFIMECIRPVLIVALGHLTREYNQLQEPLQFPDGQDQDLAIKWIEWWL